MDSGQHVGNHTHILWSCPKLNDYWKDVLQYETPKDPTVLGIFPDSAIGRDKVYLPQIPLAAAIKTYHI